MYSTCLRNANAAVEDEADLRAQCCGCGGSVGVAALARDGGAMQLTLLLLLLPQAIQLRLELLALAGGELVLQANRGQLDVRLAPTLLLLLPLLPAPPNEMRKE